MKRQTLALKKWSGGDKQINETHPAPWSCFWAWPACGGGKFIVKAQHLEPNSLTCSSSNLSYSFNDEC